MTTKLVRDRVPHTAHPGAPAPAPGQAFTVVAREGYADAVAMKMVEEVDEFAMAFSHCVGEDGLPAPCLGARTDEGLRRRAEFLTEATDVIEVVYAHARFLGVSRTEVDKAVHDRRDLRGGFDAGVILTTKDDGG